MLIYIQCIFIMLKISKTEALFMHTYISGKEYFKKFKGMINPKFRIMIPLGEDEGTG